MGKICQSRVRVKHPGLYEKGLSYKGITSHIQIQYVTQKKMKKDEEGEPEDEESEEEA